MFFFLKICLCFLATYCTANSTGKLHLREKQFIHSLNQAYALGLNDYTFGVYRSYENGSIGSSIWQGGTRQGVDVCLVLQYDANLVL